MQYLIVSDVFGRTDALEEMVFELNNSVDIIDPYDSIDMNFKNETEAYDYFVSNVGLDNYTEKLANIIQSYSQPLCLIGFSVGASAIWKISSLEVSNHISKAVCFYGSQIRHHRDIQAKFPVQLIFPNSEEYFSVSDLINDLSNRENVEIVKTNFLHGFMNSYSVNFNQSAYKKYIYYLNEH